MSEYFPKPSSHEENVKVKIDLTNYATQNISRLLLMQILQTLY